MSAARCSTRMTDSQGQHQRLLSSPAQGLGVGRQRWRRQPRCAGRPTRRPAGIGNSWHPASAGSGCHLYPPDHPGNDRCSSEDGQPERERYAKGAIREVSRHSQTWIMSLLYIGTFGSFIGFGFAFGQVLLVQFPEQFPQPVKAAALTFLGPLLGSLIRPFGGALADRFKGSVVTFFNFIAMALGALVVLGSSQIDSLPLFILGFVMLFIFSGLGNGSTYKMIPAIFHAKAQLEVGAGLDLLEADRRAIRRAGALIGLAGGSAR